MRYCEIRTFQMQDCVDDCPRGASAKSAIVSFWGHMDSFAFELDVINKKYSEEVSAEAIPETTREPFTQEEVIKLWQHQTDEWIDSILFFIYTGMRFIEMLTLTTNNVDMEKQTMICGVKTAAGKNRIIPIHSRIRHIVESRYNQSQSGYLFEKNGKKLTETTYRTIWNKTMSKIGMNHRPHDARHTLRSRLDSAKESNKVCIDRIMGHKSADVGERIYTHKTIEELRCNIELMIN